MSSRMEARGGSQATHLVDADRLAIELDLVHDATGVLGILLGQELAEAETLVSL